MLPVRVIVNGDEPVYGRRRFLELGYTDPERFQVVPYDGSDLSSGRMMAYRNKGLTSFEVSLMLTWRKLLLTTEQFPALLCESDAWPTCGPEVLESVADGYDIVRPFRYCRWGSPAHIASASKTAPFYSVADRIPAGRQRDRFFWGTHAILFCTQAGAEEFYRWLEDPDAPADWMFSDMAMAGDIDIGVTLNDLFWQYDTRRSWRESV